MLKKGSEKLLFFFHSPKWGEPEDGKKVETKFKVYTKENEEKVSRSLMRDNKSSDICVGIALLEVEVNIGSL